MDLTAIFARIRRPPASLTPPRENVSQHEGVHSGAASTTSEPDVQPEADFLNTPNPVDLPRALLEEKLSRNSSHSDKMTTQVVESTSRLVSGCAQYCGKLKGRAIGEPWCGRRQACLSHRLYPIEQEITELPKFQTEDPVRDLMRWLSASAVERLPLTGRDRNGMLQFVGQFSTSTLRVVVVLAIQEVHDLLVYVESLREYYSRYDARAKDNGPDATLVDELIPSDIVQTASRKDLVYEIVEMVEHIDYLHDWAADLKIRIYNRKRQEVKQGNWSEIQHLWKMDLQSG